MNSLQIVQETPVIELISEENSIVLDVLTINSSSTDAITLQGNGSAYHLNRANHTGSQPISSVSGLEAALSNLSEADSDLAAEIVSINNTLPNKADLVGGVIPSSQIPAVAITELLKLSGGTLPASEAQMLTLRGQVGDFTIRTDQSTTYFIASGDGSVLGDWIALPQAASPVLSVNGQTGAVTLGRADIGINSSDDIPEGVSNLYWGAQRTRDTPLTGFTLSNSPITATDSVLQAFNKAQGQINALATVARTGSYNDLSDKPAIRVRDGFDYYAYLGDRWLNPNITNQTDTPNAPWGQLHNAAIIPAANNTSLMYALLEFDLCAFPTAQADGNLVVLINGVVVNSTISSSLGNTNYFARIQLEIFRRTGGSIGYLVKSEMAGTPLFRGLYAPSTAVPFGIDLPIELRFRPTSFNTVEHISTTNCTLAVKRVQNGV